MFCKRKGSLEIFKCFTLKYTWQYIYMWHYITLYESISSRHLGFKDLRENLISLDLEQQF